MNATNTGISHLAMALFYYSCSRAPVADDRTSETNRASLRDQSRIVLERECGECHIPEYPTAIAGALKIYNLRELEWANRMTDIQLEKLSKRVVGGAREMFDPYDVRNANASPPPQPASRDIEIVQAFVRSELENRRQRRAHE